MEPDDDDDDDDDDEADASKAEAYALLLLPASMEVAPEAEGVVRVIVLVTMIVMMGMLYDGCGLR